MARLFTLDHGHRAELARILQAALVDLIGLSLSAKQAHWNLVGPGFIAVHEQLDRVVDDARSLSDDIAERIVALGHAADGRPHAVADSSRTRGRPAAIVGVEDAVAGVVADLGVAIDTLRGGLERLGQLDPVSQDLVIGALATLEKHHWMLRANAESPDRRAGHG